MGYENATGQGRFFELLQYINRTTDNWFGVTLLLVIFSIGMISFLSLNYSVKRAVATSGFISTISATFLLYLGILSQQFLVISIIVTVIATFSLLWGD